VLADIGAQFGGTAATAATTTMTPVGGATPGITITRTEVLPVSETDKVAARERRFQATILHAQGKAPEAEAAARESVRLDPTSDEAWYLLYKACYVQEKWTEAEKAVREAARLRPNDWAYRGNLAAVLYKDGRKEEAIVAARQALDLGMPKDAWILGELSITP